MLKIGPNPYGLCCTLGLQGKAQNPKGVTWFIELAEQMRGQCIEFHFGHLATLSSQELADVRQRLDASSLEAIISGPSPIARLPETILIAKALGAKTIRTHLSPVLCGARAAQGANWSVIVAEVRRLLAELGPRFADEDLILAIENHQDFGSEELIEFCEIGGNAVGINLDTGNTLAVGEDPISFVEKVASRVRHVHLKDYRAQSTPEGYRLVRCAIGDGAIPLRQIEGILSQHHSQLTAALEPGALDARHVKLLTQEWWQGYRSRSDQEKQACLQAAKINAIPAGEDWRTPWERGEDAEAVCRFEMEQMMKSVRNMQTFGWLPA